MKLNKVFELTFKIREGKKSRWKYITCKKIHSKLYRSLLFNYLKLRIDLHIAITMQQLRRKMKMCFFCSCAFAMLLTLLFHMSSQYYSLLLSRVFHNAASKEIIAFSPSQPSRVKLVRTGSS